jgi:hypothetical protein
MHNLFLGLIKEHFENILGIRVEKKVICPVVVVSLSDHWMTFTPYERKSVQKLKRWLEASMNEEL